ncbi:glycosyltransferase family 2 protein, partial [Streptomyces sp. NPDC057927]
MPRFSIIVPTHGVAGRLALALDSVLDQSFGDFELIPVCDGPDSPAGEAAAGYAARDSRVAPVHSPPADGLSGARNTGTGAASGTYLLFLDGDDILVPGALAALDRALRQEPEEADVLYFGHERVHWWDAETSTPPLPKAPEGVFTPDRAPRLTGAGLPAWSAAYRRAFLRERRLAFPPGHFTDLGWGGLVTVAAGRLAVLRQVVVRHRVRRQGSLLNTPGEHQFQLLDQVDLVLSRA